jgi:hypothetical protein
MQDDVRAALKEHFGYAPDEERGEKWVVYQDRVLLVIHPEMRPRIYRRGAIDERDYCEMEPLFD